jgi:Stealth protein CR4, conserved region 4
VWCVTSVLNDNELRTLAVLAAGQHTLDEGAVQKLHEGIYNRTVLANANAPWASQVSAGLSRLFGGGGDPYFYPSPLPPVTLDMLRADQPTITALRAYWRALGKYRHEEEDGSQVAFLMIGTNDTDLSERLDGIRKDRQKFICLNDNIDHTQPHAARQLHIIRQFFEALFPNRSPFELPDGQRNAFLHMDELFPERYNR